MAGDQGWPYHNFKLIKPDIETRRVSDLLKKPPLMHRPPFVIDMSEQGRNWSSLLAISYQFVKQWAEKLMELAADTEDLAKRVLRHSHDM